MMERLDPTVVVHADLESIRSALDAAAEPVAGVATKLAAFARRHGKPSFMGLYGELPADEIDRIRAAGFEPRISFEDGDGSAPESIGIALDAAERLAHSVAPEMAVLVSDDAQLSELVRRWRRRGTHVVVLGPASLVGAEPGRSADRAASIEALIDGSLEALRVFSSTRRDAAEPAAVRSAAVPPSPGSERSATAVERLVLLMADLESHMPFIGMRWLKNKVLGPNNVGASTPADRQRLLNSAVEQGVLATYRVGNRDGQGEPVTACRLVRENPQVAAILAANPSAAPAGPSEESTAIEGSVGVCDPRG